MTPFEEFNEKLKIFNDCCDEISNTCPSLIDSLKKSSQKAGELASAMSHAITTLPLQIATDVKNNFSEEAEILDGIDKNVVTVENSVGYVNDAVKDVQKTVESVESAVRDVNKSVEKLHEEMRAIIDKKIRKLVFLILLLFCIMIVGFALLYRHFGIFATQ